MYAGSDGNAMKAAEFRCYEAGSEINYVVSEERRGLSRGKEQSVQQSCHLLSEKDAVQQSKCAVG